MANKWRKVDKDYWTCKHWDVWRAFKEWHLSFLFGKPVLKKFVTPKEAMDYADSLDKIDETPRRNKLRDQLPAQPSDPSAPAERVQIEQAVAV